MVFIISSGGDSTESRGSDLGLVDDERLLVSIFEIGRGRDSGTSGFPTFDSFFSFFGFLEG